jgi:hypothetical protein
MRLDKVMETYLLVDDYVNLDSLLRFALEDPIEPPFREERRRTAKVKFRSKPPILIGGAQCPICHVKPMSSNPPI